MKTFTLLLLIGFTSAAQEWTADLASARQAAMTSGKKILLYFSADSCAPCEDLEETVFASDEFKAYAERHYILARPIFNDSASLTEKADQLLIIEKYNKDGFFPWVVILDASGKILNKVGKYDGERPMAYLKRLDRR